MCVLCLSCMTEFLRGMAYGTGRIRMEYYGPQQRCSRSTTVQATAAAAAHATIAAHLSHLDHVPLSQSQSNVDAMTMIRITPMISSTTRAFMYTSMAAPTGARADLKVMRVTTSRASVCMVCGVVVVVVVVIQLPKGACKCKRVHPRLPAVL